MTISNLARQNVTEVPRTHLSRLLRLLLELLNGSLVDTTALVDHVAGGGGLTGVHVFDDDDVDMDLFLSHFRLSLRQILK